MTPPEQPNYPPQSQPYGQPPVPPQQPAYPQQYSQPGYPPQQYPQQSYPQQPYPQQAYPPAPTALRTVTIDAKRMPWLFRPFSAPGIVLDGMPFPLGWGTQRYTIPADRPVHVECNVPYIWTYGKAAVVLPPGGDVHLEYSAPISAWYPGELGAPGTTTARGMVLTSVALGIGLSAMLFALVMLFLVM